MSQRRRTHAASHAEPASTRPAEPTLAPTAEPLAPEPGAALPTHDVSAPATAPTSSRRVPRTRTGAAWVGLAAAALIAVALIVFLAQNTRTTEISFLWMTARTSQAVALLIAAVGSVLITLILGTARITQLRRLARRRGGDPHRPDADQSASHTVQEEKTL
jgi:uncharacterized integral membrane protein